MTLEVRFKFSSLKVIVARLQDLHGAARSILSLLIDDNCLVAGILYGIVEVARHQEVSQLFLVDPRQSLLQRLGSRIDALATVALLFTSSASLLPQLAPAG